MDRDDYVEVVTLVQKGSTQALQNRCNVFNKFPRLFLVRYLFLDRQPGSPTPHQAEVNRMLGPVKILFSTQPSHKTSHISSYLQHLISKSAILRKYSTRETCQQNQFICKHFQKGKRLKTIMFVLQRSHSWNFLLRRAKRRALVGKVPGSNQASVSKRGYMRSY